MNKPIDTPLVQKISNIFGYIYKIPPNLPLPNPENFRDSLAKRSTTRRGEGEIF